MTKNRFKRSHTLFISYNIFLFFPLVFMKNGALLMQGAIGYKTHLIVSWER